MANQPTNIGARGIRRRGRMGVVWLVLGIIVAITLVATRAPHGWRLLVILPFTAAAIGFLQAREKTCIVLAAMDSARAHATVHIAQSAPTNEAYFVGARRGSSFARCSSPARSPRSSGGSSLVRGDVTASRLVPSQSEREHEHHGGRDSE